MVTSYSKQVKILIILFHHNEQQYKETFSFFKRKIFIALDISFFNYKKYNTLFLEIFSSIIPLQSLVLLKTTREGVAF